MKSKACGFSMAEMLVTMVIMGVLMILTVPVFMPNKEEKTGVDKNAYACAVRQLASSVDVTAGNYFGNINLATPECKATINNCLYDRGNACGTLKYYAENGNAATNDASRKVLRAACDLGGTAACKYFAENRCAGSAANCDIASSDFDINFYLTQSQGGTKPGLLTTYDIVKYYYDKGVANVVTAVNTACNSCTPQSIACYIRGIQFDDIRKKISSSKYFENGQMLRDENNNFYVAGLTHYFSSSKYTPFLVKLNKKGSVISSKILSISINDNWSSSLKMVRDNSGNIYVFYTSMSSDFIHMVKFDSNLNLIFVKKITGLLPLNYHGIKNVVVDSNNNIVILAVFNVLKVDTSGNLLWSKNISTSANYTLPNSSTNYYMEVIGNDIFVHFVIKTSVSPYLSELCLIKFTTDGSVAWKKNYVTDDPSTPAGENITINGFKAYNGKLNTIFWSGYYPASGLPYHYRYCIFEIDPVSGNLSFRKQFTEYAIGPDNLLNIGDDGNFYFVPLSGNLITKLDMSSNDQSWAGKLRSSDTFVYLDLSENNFYALTSDTSGGGPIELYSIDQANLDDTIETPDIDDSVKIQPFIDTGHSGDVFINDHSLTVSDIASTASDFGVTVTDIQDPDCVIIDPSGR